MHANQHELCCGCSGTGAPPGEVGAVPTELPTKWPRRPGFQEVATPTEGPLTG